MVSVINLTIGVYLLYTYYIVGGLLDKKLSEIYHLLEEIPLNAILKKPSKELFSFGEHLFNQLGDSIEFNQYNNYTEGDSIKHIDWKQYVKTEKIYTKKFHNESNSKAIIIFDTSKSMEFKALNQKSKEELSIILMGVFINILISSKIHVSLISKDGFTGFKYKLDDFPDLVSSIKKEENFDIMSKLSLIRSIKECNNSTIFIVSDFLYKTNELLEEIQRMNVLNYDFHLIQTLTNAELFLDYKGIIEFNDIETNQKIITEPLAIKKLYQEELNNHINNISETLLKNNMNFNLINLDKDMIKNILSLFGI